MNDRISWQDEILQHPQANNKQSSTGLTSPIKKLLETNQDLDETSRQALWNSAIASNNIDLQRALFTLHSNNTKAHDPGKQAKLAKELI
jgi:hypothetical protein